MAIYREITMSSKQKDNNPIPPVGREDAMARNAELCKLRKEVLQPIHIGFINTYFACNFNLTEAARRMDVPLKTAREWIEHPNHPVGDHIERRLARMAEKVDCTLEDVIHLLMKEATREPEDKEDHTVSHAARVSALANLARLKGGFDKKQSSGRAVSVNIQINDPKDVKIDGGDNG